MRKYIILILIAILSLIGCSSFYFGCKTDKQNNTSQNKTIENIYLGKRELGDFKIRTAPDYHLIVQNNKIILPEKVIDYVRYKSENWFIALPYIEKVIYDNINNIINPQKDAQRYINLLLSLVSDTMKYHAIVLETNNDVPYYPGEYIFISRKEIESCQDEAELAEILSFRLVRNDYLNLNAKFSQLDMNNIEESLSMIINEVKESWEVNNFASSDSFNQDLRNKVASMMIRAGFKPSYSFSLESLPSYRHNESNAGIEIQYLAPLQRHKKIFD